VTEHTPESLLHRLRCNGLAACGAYTAKIEVPMIAPSPAQRAA
jgi:hypothetical protein